MLNLAMLLEDSAREVPKRAAVIFEDTELSYEELMQLLTGLPMLLSIWASVGEMQLP